MSKAVVSSTIGYPRIGANREMKRALEAFWSSKISEEDLQNAFEAVETAAWEAQAQAGIDLIALDSTLFDQVLDFVDYLGLYPRRFKDISNGLERYFAMARGTSTAAALSLSKYFDTNYHYLVPELDASATPAPVWTKLLKKVQRGQAVVGTGKAVPIVMGIATLLHLARGEFDELALAAKIRPAYVELLQELKKLGVPEVQVHEPVLALGSLPAWVREEVEATQRALAAVGVPINLVVSYDDVTPETYAWLVRLPVEALSLDFCGVPGAAHGCGTARLIAEHGFPQDKRLGCGIVDGRSIWSDEEYAGPLLASLRSALSPSQRLSVQSSVSLQHVPLDASVETDLDPELRRGLCFAEQKLAELVRLAGGAGQGARAARPLASFGAPPPDPAESGLPESAFQRSEPYDERRPKQAKLPAFATTTIGSFPQTERMRKARLARNRGALSEEAYRERVAAEIGYAIGAQEALEVDVLVHGEAERSDMVEYFGVALQGVAFTQQGWVQSYGSRYVRPPVIAGDVSRRGPMTVREFELAQSLTSRPVKGMLTGPVTILNWSFPRKDISRAAQARQLALALRDEVADLERAGCAIVQVDEPALREGLPLKPERWAAYLSWAVRAFCLATAGARPETQVVTHLCYSSFEDVLGAIEAMDADVLTIENSRSDDAMVRALARGGYRRDLGPGVYDVHSPVVPEASAMADKLRSFVETGAEACRPDRLWVNPDCGLKTRRWEEVLPSIRNMVRAAKTLRGE